MEVVMMMKEGDIIAVVVPKVDAAAAAIPKTHGQTLQTVEEIIVVVVPIVDAAAMEVTEANLMEMEVVKIPLLFQLLGKNQDTPHCLWLSHLK
jgi:hypothetical protein